MRTILSTLALVLLSCDGGGGNGDSVPVGEGYHPAGWSAPDVHGMAAKHQEDSCLSCHGEDLSGGSVGVSCDSCHPSGWRTDCTFCHGGTENSTGAPPADIDGSTTGISFQAHTAHVVGTLHAPFECVQCHLSPRDALDAEHFLVEDDTPGVAEVDLRRGLSHDGSYSAESGCSNLYCHGTGLVPSRTVKDGETVVCGSCHAGPNDERDWRTMSGEHVAHLDGEADVDAVSCSGCHATAAEDGTIADPAPHVNGVADVTLPAGMEYSGSTCTGSCHGEPHDNRDWERVVE